MAATEVSNSLIRFDLFELDAKNCQLRRSGVLVELPPQALKILTLIVARPNELVSRKEIKNTLWPEQFHGDFDSRLNFAVKKLREGLGDSAEHPRYVQTVRQAGYMFIAPVRAVGEVMAANGDTGITNKVRSVQLETDEAISSVAARASRRQGGIVMAVVVSLAATTAAIGVLLFLFGGQGPSWLEGMPKISSVSPILPVATQRIVIRGRGLGLHVPYSHTDSPDLAIRDETGDWAAGRIIPQNTDEVMLDVESWTDDEIVVAGFSGDYGKKGWVLKEGDNLEVKIWNPQSGVGPAIYRTVVTR